MSELKEQNKNLKIKLQNMEENLQKSQAKMIGEITTISNLAHNSKMEELKNFINKLSINEFLLFLIKNLLTFYNIMCIR